MNDIGTNIIIFHKLCEGNSTNLYENGQFDVSDFGLTLLCTYIHMHLLSFKSQIETLFTIKKGSIMLKPWNRELNQIKCILLY